MIVSTSYMSLSVGVGACQLHPALWVDGVSHRCGTKTLMGATITASMDSVDRRSAHTGRLGPSNPGGLTIDMDVLITLLS